MEWWSPLSAEFCVMLIHQRAMFWKTRNKGGKRGEERDQNTNNDERKYWMITRKDGMDVKFSILSLSLPVKEDKQWVVWARTLYESLFFITLTIMHTLLARHTVCYSLLFLDKGVNDTYSILKSLTNDIQINILFTSIQQFSLNGI